MRAAKRAGRIGTFGRTVQGAGPVGEAEGESEKSGEKKSGACAHRDNVLLQQQLEFGKTLLARRGQIEVPCAGAKAIARSGCGEKERK